MRPDRLDIVGGANPLGQLKHATGFATKRQTLSQALAEYRQHINALNAKANRHLAEIRHIEEEKHQLAMTTEEPVRDIRRQGMTEFEATEDRKRQIVEYQEKAREALANGKFEQARQLAQKAMDLATQVATTQTNEAKRGEDARKQSEQSASQVAQLEAHAREAYSKQKYAQADLDKALAEKEVLIKIQADLQEAEKKLQWRAESTPSPRRCVSRRSVFADRSTPSAWPTAAAALERGVPAVRR
ncbi:MAG TPA: hypothetical protein ACQGQI_02185 [Xylella sp.]